MLTGVEIAGLVLAVLPLLIEVLDRHKKGLKIAKIVWGFRAKDRKKLTMKVDSLVRNLQWLRMNLNIHIKRLILAANPDEDIVNLPKDYKDDLWTGPLGVRVEKYLSRLGGDEFVSIFRGQMNNYQNLCAEIAEHFEGIINVSKTDKKDLKGLCDLYLQNGGKFKFAQRFGFTLDEKDIDGLTCELEEKTLSIGSFVDSSMDLDRIVTEAATKSTKRQHSKITKRLYGTRRHAYALFLALNKACNMDCHHTEHNILLHLDSQCLGQELSLTRSIRFHILFRWLAETGTQTFWKESTVITNTDSIILPPQNTTNQNIPKVAFDLPDPSVEITNACQYIALAKQNEEIYFRLSEDKLLFCSQNVTHQSRKILPPEPKLTSLDTYLISKHRDIRSSKRIELAIKLASSILQYNDTEWCKKGWQKDCIYFFEKTGSFPTAEIDVDHPLILESFPAANLSTKWPEPEDTLLELGILLMELYHRTKFEDWLTENHPKFDQKSFLGDVDYKRTYASKWHKALPRTADFHSVVGICLAPHPLRQFESSWEDDHFRSAFYVHVISPLLAF